MQQPFVEYLIERDLISPSVAGRLNQKRYIREPIGMIAVGHGLFDPNQIDIVLDRQRASKDRFGDIAVELGFLSREQVEVLARIQEFRISSEIAEALALTGILSIEDAGRYLGSYLMRDRELAAMMADA